MSEFKIQDVRIDTYRPAVCQLGTFVKHAIRMTHIPTGLVEESRGNGSTTKAEREMLKKLKERFEDGFNE